MYVLVSYSRQERVFDSIGPSAKEPSPPPRDPVNKILRDTSRLIIIIFIIIITKVLSIYLRIYRTSHVSGPHQRIAYPYQTLYFVLLRA